MSANTMTSSQNQTLLPIWTREPLQPMTKYELDVQRYDAIVAELEKLGETQRGLIRAINSINTDGEMTDALWLKLDSLYDQADELQNQIHYLEYFLKLDYDEFVAANEKYELIAFCNGVPVVDYD